MNLPEINTSLFTRLRFILVQTSRAGNIGAVARAMKTMGFSELVLVSPRFDDALADPDFAKAVVALRLAILFMHSRIELDCAELKLRMKSRIELEIRRDVVGDHPTVAYWMEKEQELWDEVGVDFSIRANG